MGSVGVSRWAELCSGSQLPAALLLEQLSHCFPGHILRLGPEKSLRSSSRCSSQPAFGGDVGLPPQAPPAGPGHRTCLLLSSLLQNEQILTLLWVDRCCGFGSPGIFQGPGKSANSNDGNFPRRIAVGFQDPPAGLRTSTFLLKPRSWWLLPPFPRGRRGGVCRRSAGGLWPLLTCRSSFQATGRRGGSWANTAELVSRGLVGPGDQQLLPLSHLPFPPAGRHSAQSLRGPTSTPVGNQGLWAFFSLPSGPQHSSVRLESEPPDLGPPERPSGASSLGVGDGVPVLGGEFLAAQTSLWPWALISIYRDTKTGT